MRAAIVRRVVLGLSLLFLAASLLFAWRASRPRPRAAAATSGSALYARHCAQCHPRAELLETLRESPRGESDLRTFLADHGRASATEDRVIVAELLVDVEDLERAGPAPDPGGR